MATTFTKIRSLLHGCEPGRMQSVGWMQVIPLVSELQDERFISPAQAKVATRGYGNLNVRNTEDKPMIVPQGAAYIVEQAAQNHALPHIGMVKARALKEFNTAMCIQARQGGYIAEGTHRMMLLPFPLREPAHKVRKDTSFNRLWPAIAEFNRSAGVADGAGHLELFFNHYKDQLDTFVAQFEPVKRQIGAIILIGGKVVGVERMPSYQFFDDMWRALIRECYGALALVEAQKVGTPPVPKTRVPLEGARNLADLRKALEKAETEEMTRVGTLVENLMEIDLPRTQEPHGESGCTIDGLGDDKFIGQAVRDGEKVLYASLVATNHWRANEDWLQARPFTMGQKRTARTRK